MIQNISARVRVSFEKGQNCASIRANGEWFEDFHRQFGNLHGPFFFTRNTAGGLCHVIIIKQHVYKQYLT